MRKALIKRLLGFVCIIVLMALNLNVLAFAEPSPANDSFYYATKIDSNAFISEKIETATDKDFYTFFFSVKQIREAVRGFIDSIIKIPLQVIDRLYMRM